MLRNFAKFVQKFGAVLIFVKYVGCFQDAAYHDPSHLYNNCTKKCLHLNSLILLHHVSCTQSDYFGIMLYYNGFIP